MKHLREGRGSISITLELETSLSQLVKVDQLQPRRRLPQAILQVLQRNLLLLKFLLEEEPRLQRLSNSKEK